MVPYILAGSITKLIVRETGRGFVCGGRIVRSARSQKLPGSDEHHSAPAVRGSLDFVLCQ
jgi:hypothetical protein